MRSNLVCRLLQRLFVNCFEFKEVVLFNINTGTEKTVYGFIYVWIFGRCKMCLIAKLLFAYCSIDLDDFTVTDVYRPGEHRQGDIQR